jgi:hypothetical protein
MATKDLTSTVTTKDPRAAAQFRTKREAAKAARQLLGYGPSDVIRIEVMGFIMWAIADAHMNYVSKVYYDRVVAGRSVIL